MNDNIHDAGFVYFAKADELIKIGCSSEPYNRCVDLTEQTGIAHHLLGAVPVAYKHRFERHLHMYLSQHHVKGEYFRLSSEMLPSVYTYLESISHQDNGLVPIPADKREWFYSRRTSRNPNCLRIYIGGFDWNNFPDEYPDNDPMLAELFWQAAPNEYEIEFRNK